MSRDSASGFGIGLLVGVALGLSVGMLYAPKPGGETRKMIQERAGDVVERARRGVTRLRGKRNQEEDDEDA